MIDGLPLSFFLPLVVHAVAGMTTVVTGILTFTRPKHSDSHPTWGGRYLLAYTVVFLTAPILAVQHWPADAYLVMLAVAGYSAAVLGYGVQRFRLRQWVHRLVGRWDTVMHLSGMISSFVILLTAFYVDNGHLLPLVQDLPMAVLWGAPSVIALPFFIRALRRYVPKRATIS